MEEEIWKPIEENKNYLISNYGNIKSLYSGKLLKKCKRGGYPYAVLYVGNKKQVGRLVHRLVAKAFIENPNNYFCINHKDENKQNCFVGNLEWCNYHYNNTYNNIAKKRGKKLKGKEPWNKGKTNIYSKETLKKMSETVKTQYKTGKRHFIGNQYTNADIVKRYNK